MKKIFLSLFVLMISVVAINAQMDKGFIKVEITDVSSDNEQMAMQLEMMKGTETNYYFSGDKYVTKMSMMGGMVNMENHINTKTKKMDMLMDAMGSKLWVDTNLDEAKSGQEALTNEDVNISYDKSDTKKIHGLDAYKFTMEVPNPQMKMNISGYLTEEINTEGNLIQGMEKVSLAGFPLEFTVKNSVMEMKMEATEVSKDVNAGIFDLKTDGYKKMTWSEFQTQMGSMGGGMGF